MVCSHRGLAVAGQRGAGVGLDLEGEAQRLGEGGLAEEGVDREVGDDRDEHELLLGDREGLAGLRLGQHGAVGAQGLDLPGVLAGREVGAERLRQQGARDLADVGGVLVEGDAERADAEAGAGGLGVGA